MTGRRAAGAPARPAKGRAKAATTPGARARSADASTGGLGEGAGQDGASREADLLADFESRKQRGERFTIAEFCRAHGYATAKGIRRFDRLRAVLHAYCGGGARGRVQPPDAIAAMRRDLEAREAEIVRLRARLAVIAPLEARAEAAEAARAHAVAEAHQLRAMVTALVSQIAPQSVKRAEAIERELLAAARPLVPGLPDRVPEPGQGGEGRLLSLVREDA